VTRSKVEALRVSTEMEKVQGQLSAAQTVLNLLLGLVDNLPLVIVVTLDTIQTIPPLVDLLLRAEEQNQLIVVLRQVVERERLNVKLAKSVLIPDPSIDLAKRDNVGVGVSGPIIGLSFVVPLWDRQEGAIAAAGGKLAVAEATLRASRLQVR